MPTTSLQKLQRALQDHAKTEARDRKKHDGRLYALGRMVEAAGLFDVDDKTLVGMFAVCSDDLSKMRDRWHVRGIKETESHERPVKVPARAIFSADASLSKQARTALAAEGLKEIRKADVKLGFGIAPDLQLWSGQVADYAVADSVVSELGGTLQRLGAAVAQLNEAAE
jgi:hypothetical protein